jgi:hypothetical protein
MTNETTGAKTRFISASCWRWLTANAAFRCSRSLLPAFSFHTEMALQRVQHRLIRHFRFQFVFGYAYHDLVRLVW